MIATVMACSNETWFFIVEAVTGASAEEHKKIKLLGSCEKKNCFNMFDKSTEKYNSYQ
jgi:hypothetical protein